MYAHLVDEILDETGAFGRTKNDILDSIFLVSLHISPSNIPFWFIILLTNCINFVYTDTSGTLQSDQLIKH